MANNGIANKQISISKPPAAIGMFSLFVIRGDDASTCAHVCPDLGDERMNNVIERLQ